MKRRDERQGEEENEGQSTGQERGMEAGRVSMQYVPGSMTHLATAMEETHTLFLLSFTCLSRLYKTTLNVSSLSVSPRRPCVCDTHFRPCHFSQRRHALGHSGQRAFLSTWSPSEWPVGLFGKKATLGYRKSFALVLKGLELIILGFQARPRRRGVANSVGCFSNHNVFD